MTTYLFQGNTVFSWRNNRGRAQSELQQQLKSHIYSSWPVYFKSSQAKACNHDYESAVSTFINSNNFTVYKQQVYLLIIKLASLINRRQSFQNHRNTVSFDNGEVISGLIKLYNRLLLQNDQARNAYYLATEGKATLERLVIELSRQGSDNHRQLVIDLLRSDDIDMCAPGLVNHMKHVTDLMCQLTGESLLAKVRDDMVRDIAASYINPYLDFSEQENWQNGINQIEQIHFVNGLFNIAARYYGFRLDDDYLSIPEDSLRQQLGEHLIEAFLSKIERSVLGDDYINALKETVKIQTGLVQMAGVNEYDTLKNLLDTLGPPPKVEGLSELHALYNDEHNEIIDEQFGFILLRRLADAGYVDHVVDENFHNRLYMIAGDIHLSFIQTVEGYRSLEYELTSGPLLCSSGDESGPSLDIWLRRVNHLSRLGQLKCGGLSIIQMAALCDNGLLATLYHHWFHELLARDLTVDQARSSLLGQFLRQASIENNVDLGRQIISELSQYKSFEQHNVVQVQSTCLHIMAEYDRAELIKAVADNLAIDFDYMPEKGYFSKETPLIVAARQGRFQSIKRLIEKGKLSEQSINHVYNLADWSALHWAIYNGQSQSVELLLAYGADIYQLCALNGNYYTPLHIAIIYNDQHMVGRLLRAGASSDSCISFTNGYGHNYIIDQPLQMAVKSGRLELTRTLIEVGELSGHRLDSCIDVHGCNPLHNAVSNGHYQIVQLLLAMDADIQAPVNPSKEAKFWALHLAVMHGHSDILRLICQKTHVLPQAVYNNGEQELPPLIDAIQRGHLLAVQILIEQSGISSKSLDRPMSSQKAGIFSGLNPLHLALANGYEAIVDYLVNYGMDVNVKAIDEQSPFYAHQFLAMTDNKFLKWRRPGGQNNTNTDDWRLNQRLLRILMNASGLMDETRRDMLEGVCTFIFHRAIQQDLIVDPELVHTIMLKQYDLANISQFEMSEYCETNTALRDYLSFYKFVSTNRFEKARELICNRPQMQLGVYIHNEPVLHYLIHLYNQCPSGNLFSLISDIVEHPKVARQSLDNRGRYDYQLIAQLGVNELEDVLWPDWQRKLNARIEKYYNLMVLVLTENVDGEGQLLLQSTDRRQLKCGVSCASSLLSNVIQKLNDAIDNTAHPVLLKQMLSLTGILNKTGQGLSLQPEVIEDVDILQSLLADLYTISLWLDGYQYHNRANQSRAIPMTVDLFEKYQPSNKRRRQTTLDQFNLFSTSRSDNDPAVYSQTKCQKR